MSAGTQGGGGQHAELSGYHAKRHEFEPEYDQDAELMVAELEFRETDTQVPFHGLRCLAFLLEGYWCSLAYPGIE